MFRFPNLPNELKTQVIKSLSYDESLQALKVSKSLRDYFLYHGPNIDKIELVHIRFGRCEIQTRADLRYCFEMTLNLRNHSKISIYLDEYDYQVNRVKYTLDQRKIIPFFNKKAYRSLLVDIGDFNPYLPDDYREKFVEIFEFLQNFFKNLQIIGNFKLAAHFDEGKIFVDSLKNAQILDSVLIEIDERETEEEEVKFEDFMENLLENRLLRDCRCIFPSYDEKRWEKYQKSNAPVLFGFIGYWGDAEELLEKILNQGIPSKDPDTILGLYNHSLWCTRFVDKGDELFESITEEIYCKKGVQIVDPLSEEAKDFLKFLMDNSRTLFEGDFFDEHLFYCKLNRVENSAILLEDYDYRAIYKKRISEKEEVQFVFLQRDFPQWALSVLQILMKTNRLDV